MSADRLAAARERLAGALLAGEDTAPFRRALGQLEAETLAADALAAERAAATDAESAAAIQAKADFLAAECRRQAAAGGQR